MTKTAFIRWNDREDLKLYYLIVDTKTIAVLGAEVPDFVERFIDPLGNDLRRAVVRLGRIPEIEHTNILSTFETELKQMANTIFSIHILSREEIGTHEKELAIRLENSADAGAEHWRRLRESAIQKLEQIDKEEFEQTAPPKGQAQDAADQSGAANQAQAKIIDYSTIKDHKERRVKMFTDGIKPSDISRWEKENRDEISTSKNPLPSTDIDAIKKCIQRAQKAGTK